MIHAIETTLKELREIVIEREKDLEECDCVADTGNIKIRIGIRNDNPETCDEWRFDR